MLLETMNRNEQYLVLPTMTVYLQQMKSSFCSQVPRKLVFTSKYVSHILKKTDFLVVYIPDIRQRKIPTFA